MRTGIIYIATNTINNKVYIGQTIQGLQKRKSQHIKNAVSKCDNMYFHKAIRKYGKDNFKWEVLVDCPISDLNDQEIYWIKYWDSFGKRGYNSTIGGSLGANGFKGRKHSIETKLLLSIRSKEDGYGMRGKKHSAHSRKKMSIQKKGKLLYNAHKQKLSKIRQGINNPNADSTIYTFYNKELDIIEKCTRLELQDKYGVKSLGGLFATRVQKTAYGWSLLY